MTADPTSLALDLFGIVPGKTGGMEEYATRLAWALAAAHPDAQFLIGVRPEAAERFSGLVKCGNVKLLSASVPGPLRRVPYAQSLAEWVKFSSAARERQVQLLHATYATVRPPWHTGRFVVTLPDVYYSTLRNVLGEAWFRLYDAQVRTTARRAKRVLTISEYSRQSIIRHLGLGPAKVVVTYCGVDHERFSPLSPEETARLRESRPDLPPRFLLYPSALLPHKNHATLFRALAVLRDQNRVAVPLLLTGSANTPAAAGILAEIERLRLSSQVRWAGVVPADELLTYLRLATAVVFPSLMEGFGLPVVEAMACGTPVACSNTTATAEIAGEAALTFDPSDAGAVAEAILRILDDDALRSTLTQRGLRRAAEFTWERTAADTWACYEDVIRGGGAAPQGTSSLIRN